jgi:hypothetical protein
MMQPSDQMSARASSSALAERCSGDMYPGVPITWLLRRPAFASIAQRLMPKSSSFTQPRPRPTLSSSPTTKMFSGLISRCTTPWACATASMLISRISLSRVGALRCAPR